MDADQSGHPGGPSAGPAGIFNLAGCTLGKYRLIEKIGQGGMAQVYKAFQPDLDRYVALKILHLHLTGDEDFAARFRREARAVAALEHPNIVRIYDFDTDQGLAFLVMEYLEGASLKAVLHDLDCRDEWMELKRVGYIVGALAVWPEYQAEVYDYQIERLVKRLREKLEPDPRNPVLIHTVRGRGYKLATGS